MSVVLSLGIDPLLPRVLPAGFSRTDVLFAIAEQAQELSLVDVELRDRLAEGEARAWPGSDEATWYVVQMPDVMGPAPAPDPADRLARWSALRVRSVEPHPYPQGAIFVPWIQRAGRLKGAGAFRFLDGVACVPLGALRDVVDAEPAVVEELIADCARARVPVSVAPDR